VERHGCDFESFFSSPDGATPNDLLQRGIYSEIAVPLKGGAWREASMALFAQALGMSKKQSVVVEDGFEELAIALGMTAVVASTTRGAVKWLHGLSLSHSGRRRRRPAVLVNRGTDVGSVRSDVERSTSSMPLTEPDTIVHEHPESRATLVPAASVQILVD